MISALQNCVIPDTVDLASSVESTLVRPGRISRTLGSQSLPPAAVLSDNTAQIPSVMDTYITTSNGVLGPSDNLRGLACSIPMEISHETRTGPLSSPDIAEHTSPLGDHGHGLNELYF